ncbi:MAG: heparinase II/III family protein, partial [Spirochaetia bacterium]|nr:heparinase II/III family protein [Spirochaetia bacterium]
TFPGFFYTRGFYLRAAAYVYDWCFDVMSASERQTLRNSIAVWAKIFYDRTPREGWETWAENTLNQVWNWNAGISASLGLACLAILDETDDPARQWLFQATRQVENYYRFAIDANGGAVEGPAYVGYGAAPTPHFIEALRRITGEDLFENTHYKKITDFIAHEALPGGGRILNICDSGYRIDYWQYFIYATSRIKDPGQASWFYQSMTDGVGGHFTANLVSILLWGSPADRAVAGYSPDKALEHFGYSPWRGVMMSRTGWKKEDVLFTIHAQECTLIKHDQADKGQINFFAYGQDFLIDSGYGNDGDMTKSSGTHAHNLVLIDGKGQSGGSVQAYNNGHLRDHLHTSAADFARVDMKDAYEFNFGPDYVKNKTRSMKKADRHALFARGSAPYLI